ncbi:MAG: sigma-70 family RNA polymerase sigma factor [Desulfobulbaceae bacterium]|nr:sigma-70 family RNA polymerase sigma factor [Desulfobulbaceae bacterium]
MPEIIDLLATTPSVIPFVNLAQDLNLSSSLEKKVLLQEGRLPGSTHSTVKTYIQLTADDEKELATEVLLLRHRFTELVLHSRKFRQAALTIIQNIYLFQNRKIFFGTLSSMSSDEERQEALLLFSSTPSRTSISLAKTFQHLVLARVWNRILGNSTDPELQEQQFIELHSIVVKLNTIRNIYMLLTTGLIKKLVAQINDIYKESVTFEDAVQIGSFGIARAAYRYHQSSGVRFSTFAANWVFKEIQRQSLTGRLIRLSANTVEQYTKALKTDDAANFAKYTTRIQNATITGEEILNNSFSTSCSNLNSDSHSLVRDIESQELKATLLNAIDHLLSQKSGDIIKRRYGLPPYQNNEQSVISISKIYGVTRGSIYQLEQSALKKLNAHLQSAPH